MSFITLAYLLFLLGACLLYYIFPKAVRPFWLLVCSYLFYLYEPENAGLVLVLLCGTLVTYVAGLLLGALPKENKTARRCLVAFAFLACLGCLLYFKYAGFLAGIFGQKLSISIVEPLGISYFTFSSLSYVMDVYRGKLEPEKHFLYYALFVSFFPCIVAGPIERAGNLLVQFRAEQTFDYERVSGGMFRILWGFFKKLVVANTLYAMIKTVIGNMELYPGPVLLLAALGFSYYLYCDFSALSDIAIGSAALFGIGVMENFKRPLAAPSFNELWKRWHISLTSWLREYLYFPLGGNRKGKVRTCLNQLIVFVASGLWHGASWGYLLWGFLNGVYLVVGKETEIQRRRWMTRNPLYRWKPLKHFLQACVTYLLFTSCIVFFCTEIFGSGIADGFYLYGHLFTGWSGWSEIGSQLAALGLTGTSLWILLGSLIVVEGFEYLDIPTHQLIRKCPVYLRWPLYFALLFTIFFFGEFGVSAFVYQAY